MASRPSTPKRAAADREERAARTLSALKRITATAKRRIVKMREQGDLSGAQLWALTQVKSAPGQTMQELAAALAIHQSTASNLVEKLDSGGFVRKKRETLDRRVVRLYITAAGTQLLRKAPSPAQDVLPEAVKQLTDEELRALEQSLQLLAKKLGLDLDAKQPITDLPG